MASAVAPAAPQRLSPDFWKFWTGQTISQLGSSFTQFATPLLIFKLTRSAVNLGIATAATFVPYLLFGLIIGAWVDRLNRKRLMIAVDLLRAGVIALIPLLSVLNVLEVWHIYLIGFASSTLTIFFEASEFAAIPSLVGQDDLVTANGRIQASYSGAAVAGPLLAGLLLAVVKIETVFLVDALSFVASAYSLGLVSSSFNKEQGEERKSSTIRSDVAEGLRYVLRHPALRNISAMMALFNFITITTFTQLVLFAKERLDATDAMVGILFSAGSLGVVVLGLLAGRIRKHLKFGPAALGSLFIIGLLTVAFAVNRMYWLALVLWGLGQGLGIFFNINTGSLRQAIVPNHLLGRIISIAGVLAWSAIPLGSLLGGFAVHWTGSVALVYGVIGVISSAIAVWFFFFSPLGHAERYLPGGDLAAPPEEATGVPLTEVPVEPAPTFGEASESPAPTHPAS
jgi:MFS family permease